MDLLAVAEERRGRRAVADDLAKYIPADAPDWYFEAELQRSGLWEMMERCYPTPVAVRSRASRGDSTMPSSARRLDARSTTARAPPLRP